MIPKRIKLAVPLRSPIEGSIVKLKPETVYLLQVTYEGVDFERFCKQLGQTLKNAFVGIPKKAPTIIIVDKGCTLYELESPEEQSVATKPAAEGD